MGCSLICFSWITPKNFIFNLTESVPLGLYKIEAGVNIPKKSLIVFRFEERWLIKEVVGIQGDWFCVSEEGDFSVNREWMGKAKANDSYGKKLTRVEGCQKVAADEWVVRGTGDRSFDSRYFGTIKSHQILGKAMREGGKKT